MVNHVSNAAASGAVSATTGKKTEGRRKVEMKKLEKKIKQQVTFSKRRSGLFKKASELCLLCGAEIAIITFSPAKRVFCYGHRDLDTILDCYIARKTLPEAKENLFPVHSLNKEYEDSQRELEREKQKQKAAAIEVVPKKAWYEDGGFWWEKSVDNLGLEELEEYMVSMQELRRKVALKADHMMMMRTDSMLSKSINGAVNQFDNQDGDGGAAASANHNSFN